MAETRFIRVQKERDYTVLNNIFIRDKTLSWKAKGVMTYLLSLPDDWSVYLSEIQTHATDGRDSLRTAINELVEHGYLVRTQVRNDSGKFGSLTYEIVESPADLPFTEKPLAVKPKADNPKLLNTNNTKYEYIPNTDNIYSEKKEKVSKHKYGEYKNVLLTEKELDTLCNELGEDKAKGVIKHFSELKEMKGYKYKSDYLALRKWGIRAYEDTHGSSNVRANEGYF